MNAIRTDSHDDHVVAPGHLAALRFRFWKPRDFRLSKLPIEPVDLARQVACLPLVVALTPIGPMVFSVALLPARPDGALSECLERICRAEGFDRREIRQVHIGPLSGVTCEAIQHGQGLDMRMFLVLIEDGGRVFQIMAMSPMNLWSSAEARFRPMLQSFELEEVYGATQPLFPAGVC